MFALRTSALSSLAVGLLTTLLFASGAHAQSGDKNADKAARRAQLQLQSLQQQVQEAQAAKARVEVDKSEVDRKLVEQTQAVDQLQQALAKANGRLKVSEAARKQLLVNVAALEKQAVEQKRTSEDALAQKARELAQYTTLRNQQQALLQRQHDDQVAQVAECSTKNDKLVRLSAELLDRYRGKTVRDVLAQREPVLGIGDVQMFNLVQDYRDRADAERYTPPAPQAAPPPLPSATAASSTHR